MINRKSVLACGIAAAIFTVSSAGAASLERSHVGVSGQPNFHTPNGSTILFDQTGNPSTNSTTAQNFSSSYDSYDNEAADDFVVPAGGWSVNAVNILSTTSAGFTGATTAVVNFYPDAGGVPGATATCSYPAAPAIVDAASTSITLPTGCALAAGTYWVGVSVTLDFDPDGQIYWTNDTVGSLSDSVWRNPGDAFATGCTDWDTLAACGVGGGVDPGESFQLLGTVGGGGTPLAEARELPTLSQWSALLAASGLALVGLFGVRRRSRR